MAPSCQRTPSGMGTPEAIDDGTSCRLRSPTPGPVGADASADDSVFPDATAIVSHILRPEPGATVLSYLDSGTRLEYVKAGKSVSEALLDYMNQNPGSHMALRSEAVEWRNWLLDDARSKLSPGARQLSRALKEEGKKLAELEPKYARRLLAERELVKNAELAAQNGLQAVKAGTPGFDQNAFDNVARKLAETEFTKATYASDVQQLQQSEEVSRAIIAAAGRNNRVMTVVAKFSRVTGPASIGIQVVLGGIEVLSAKDDERLSVLGREESAFAGGWIGAQGGGMLAGYLVSSIPLCKGNVICALAVTVVLVGLAAWGGAELAERVANSAQEWSAIANNPVVGGLADDGVKGGLRGTLALTGGPALAAPYYFLIKKFWF